MVTTGTRVVCGLLAAFVVAALLNFRADDPLQITLSRNASALPLVELNNPSKRWGSFRGKVAPAGPHPERHCAPFSDIVLVINQARSDKVPTLHAAYGRHFLHVAYVGVKGGAVDVSAMAELLRAAGATVDPCLDAETQWYDSSYTCVAPLLVRLASRFKGARGALVLHADFWISPSFGCHRDRSKVWSLSPFQNVTLSVARESKKYFWSEHMVLFEHARERLNTTFYDEGLRLDFEHVIKGWLDHYYVPAAAWSLWHRVIAVITDERPPAIELINEFALPLSFEVLRQLHFRGEANWSEKVEECWGGCCITTCSAAVMWESSCGHKMELRSPEVRAALVGLWNGSSISDLAWSFPSSPAQGLPCGAAARRPHRGWRPWAAVSTVGIPLFLSVV